MRIHLIAVGTRMPAWISAGYLEYAKRMPPECPLGVVEIPLQRRGKGADVERLRRREGEQMLAAIPPGSRVLALDGQGRQWSTEELAVELDRWLAAGRDLALLVGGPEGLAPACRERAERLWSLSALTLPHALVRVLVAEQLYRAWTIRSGHPYHR